MTDIIENFYNSVIHHGKENDRVYLMSLDPDKVQETIDYIESLSDIHRYSKNFVKIPSTFLSEFQSAGYKQEAMVPNFYMGKVDGVFLAKYPLTSAERNIFLNKEIIDEVIEVSKAKTKSELLKINDYYHFEILNKDDVEQITSLYKKVFKSYPFPIFSNEYILKTMNNNVCYFGIKKNNKLVSIASAEMDKSKLNAEMTDFATCPDFRGESLSLYLLQQMEQYIKSIGLKTAYTIARSISYGMNITFAKNDYKFGGTLTNNTNISGSIESMNVWYKSLY